MPASGYKVAMPAMELVNRGTLSITRDIVFPVRAEHAMELGAITLMLDYDKDLIEITGIEMSDNGGEMPYYIADGMLHIGWMSLNPISVEAGQTVLTIHARTINKTMATNIRFTLNANPLSELADGDGNVIENAKLSIADAMGNGEIAKWRNSEAAK